MSRADRARSRPTRWVSATTRWCWPSGWVSGSRRRPSWRRTSRWPTSGSTCSARRGRCSRTPARPTAAARTTLAYLRDADGVPQRAAGRAARRRRLRPRASPGCWSSRATRYELYAPARLVRRRDAGRGRRQGGQGGRLPPRPRDPVGAAPRRRHRRVAPADAGRARCRVAVRRRAVRGRPTGRRARRAWRSTRLRCASRCWPTCARCVARATLSDARGGARGRAAGGVASTPRRWRRCWPRCRGSRRAMPGVTW